MITQSVRRGTLTSVSRLGAASSLRKKNHGNQSSFGRMTAIAESHAPTSLATGTVQDVVAPPKESEPEKLVRFWKDVLSLLRTGADDSILHNVARLDYEVKIGNIPENLTDPDIKVSI